MKRRPLWEQNLLALARATAPPLHPVIAELNANHAVVLVQVGWLTRARIMREFSDHLDRDAICFTHRKDMELFYADRRVYPNGKRVSAVAFWLSHPDRRTYRNFGVWPQGDAPVGAFNLWRGGRTITVDGRDAAARALRDLIERWAEMRDWRARLRAGR